MKCPSNTLNPAKNVKMQARVHSRHKTVNAIFKNFAILADVHRHDITQHDYIFCAVAVLTQLSIENGDALFEVTYKM